jgi:hypothetical protein
MLFQGFDDVVCIGHTFILYTKIIHDKGEGDGDIVMCPYTRSFFGLLVAMGVSFLARR